MSNRNLGAQMTKPAGPDLLAIGNRVHSHDRYDPAESFDRAAVRSQGGLSGICRVFVLAKAPPKNDDRKDKGAGQTHHKPFATIFDSLPIRSRYRDRAGVARDAALIDPQAC